MCIDYIQLYKYVNKRTLFKTETILLLLIHYFFNCLIRIILYFSLSLVISLIKLRLTYFNFVYIFLAYRSAIFICMRVFSSVRHCSDLIWNSTRLIFEIYSFIRGVDLVLKWQTNINNQVILIYNYNKKQKRRQSRNMNRFIFAYP